MGLVPNLEIESGRRDILTQDRGGKRHLYRKINWEQILATRISGKGPNTPYK